MDALMDRPSEQAALEVLRSFYAEMYEWELNAAKKRGAIDWQSFSKDEYMRDGAILRKKLEEIFERYCEVGVNSKRLRDPGLSFSLGKPTYDWQEEEIIAVTTKGNRAVVETKELKAYGTYRKFELVESGHQWKIRDNLKYKFKSDSKWAPDIL